MDNNDYNYYPEPDYKKERRHFSYLGISAALMLITTNAVYYLFVWLIKTCLPAFEESVWYTWVTSLAPIYLAALPLFWLLLLRVPAAKPGARDNERMSGKGLMICLMLAFAFMYIGSLVGNNLMQVINNFTGNEAGNSVSEMLLGSEFYINLVVAVIIAPIMEEFIFRKLIIDRTRVFGERNAMILSALIFALFHGNLYQFFYTLLLGLLLGYIYLRYGKLRYCVFLHMAVNFMGGVVAPWIVSHINMEALQGLADENTMSQYEEFGDFIAYINESLGSSVWAIALIVIYSFALIIAAILGIVWLVRNRKNIRFRAEAREIPRERAMTIIYMNAGMIVMICLCIFSIALSIFAS